MPKQTFLPTRLAAMLALAFAFACSPPTDGDVPGVEAAKGGPGGGGPSPTVDATDPSAAEQGTTLDVRVLGSNYDEGSSVDFLLDGKPTQKVKTNSSSFVSPTEVVANITIAADAVVDLYDVRVTTAGGKKGVGIEKFEVLLQGPPGQWDPPQLTITMRQGSGGGTDAVRADDEANTAYTTNASISGNGNLQFWLGSGNSRAVLFTTSYSGGETRDRIYTNNHTNPGGDDSFGLLGMLAGSSGTAVFEVELNLSDNDPYEVLRYGKDCTGKGSGGGNVVEGTKVATVRLGERNWTITGTSGVHCKQLGKKPGLSEVGTAEAFSMTLYWRP
jgi:hypothetical protein